MMSGLVVLTLTGLLCRADIDAEGKLSVNSEITKQALHFVAGDGRATRG